MPSTETITVKPANTTARPEVVIASSTAASGDLRAVQRRRGSG